MRQPQTEAAKIAGRGTRHAYVGSLFQETASGSGKSIHGIPQWMSLSSLADRDADLSSVYRNMSSLAEYYCRHSGAANISPKKTSEPNSRSRLAGKTSPWHRQNDTLKPNSIFLASYGLSVLVTLPKVPSAILGSTVPKLP